MSVYFEKYKKLITTRISNNQKQHNNKNKSIDNCLRDVRNTTNGKYYYCRVSKNENKFVTIGYSNSNGGTISQEIRKSNCVFYQPHTKTCPQKCNKTKCETIKLGEKVFVRTKINSNKWEKVVVVDIHHKQIQIQYKNGSKYWVHRDDRNEVRTTPKSKQKLKPNGEIISNFKPRNQTTKEFQDIMKKISSKQCVQLFETLQTKLNLDKGELMRQLFYYAASGSIPDSMIDSCLSIACTQQIRNIKKHQTTSIKIENNTNNKSSDVKEEVNYDNDENEEDDDIDITMVNQKIKSQMKISNSKSTQTPQFAIQSLNHIKKHNNSTRNTNIAQQEYEQQEDEKQMFNSYDCEPQQPKQHKYNKQLQQQTLINKDLEKQKNQIVRCELLIDSTKAALECIDEYGKSVLELLNLTDTTNNNHNMNYDDFSSKLAELKEKVSDANLRAAQALPIFHMSSRGLRKQSKKEKIDLRIGFKCVKKLIQDFETNFCNELTQQEKACIIDRTQPFLNWMKKALNKKQMPPMKIIEDCEFDENIASDTMSQIVQSMNHYVPNRANEISNNYQQYGQEQIRNAQEFENTNFTNESYTIDNSLLFRDFTLKTETAPTQKEMEEMNQQEKQHEIQKSSLAPDLGWEHYNGYSSNKFILKM